MVDVEFNMENIQRCLCPGCPVQAKSECVQDKMSKLQSQSGGIPAEGDVPEVYCSTGKATCENLDENQPCQCDKCKVWKQYNLDKAEINYYYCIDGKAR